jgi:hypothetical protein
MHITLRSGAVVLALALTLASCGQPATPAPTQAPAVTAPAASEPTAQAPAAQTPAQAPTAAATAEPIAADLLPAPLLFINERNELARIEVDGETITTLTREDSLIIDFAVGPNGGPLAFVTVAEGDQRAMLVRINADGTGRTELASGTIRGVTVAADGSVQAGALFATTRADGAALAAGAWSFPLDGGEPTLLAAGTEPTADASGNVNAGVHYQPLAWSPDGSTLLLHTSMNMGPDGPGGDIGTNGLALYDPGTSQSRDLLPIGQEWICAGPAWGLDGASVLCANNAAIGAPTPALWRLRLADGGQEAIIPAAEPLTATFSPRELPEGLYVLAGSYQDSGLALMPQRIPPGGAATNQLPLPIQAGFDGGLWAPDGSGVIFGRPAAGANRTVVWQPLGEGEPVELLSGSIGRLAWATR